jgi:hypothetical protein
MLGHGAVGADLALRLADLIEAHRHMETGHKPGTFVVE